MTSRLLILRFILFAGLLIAAAARADWINLTGAETAPNIAEITVYDDRVEVALENRRSMAIQQAGGVQAKIKEVAVEEARAERIDGEGLTYAVRGTWTALGTVGHWGHVHQRKNRYEAVVTVAAQDGAWKIVDLELRDERRVDQSPSTASDMPSTKQGAAPAQPPS
jgi:hypothetical protein